MKASDITSKTKNKYIKRTTLLTDNEEVMEKVLASQNKEHQITNIALTEKLSVSISNTDNKEVYFEEKDGKDILTIRIKMFDTKGNDRSYDVYNNESKKNTASMTAEEVVKYLKDEYNFEIKTFDKLSFFKNNLRKSNK